MIKVFSKIKYFLDRKPAKLAIIPLLAFLIPTKFVYAFSFNPIDWVKSAVGATASLLMFPMEFIIDLIFRVVFVAVNFILGSLVSLSAWIFNWSLMLSMKSENYDIVETGWAASLAFANNFIVLIFLGIAIATILRLEQFNYKKMLPTFIMVALLINFSLVIGKVIIDVTNIFTISFSNQILTASDDASQGNSAESPSSIGGQGDASTVIAAKMQVQTPVKNMDDQFDKMVDDGDTTTTGFTGLFSIFLYQIFVYLVTIFTFLAGAVYMISRAFWLWLLLMLAPLAWISLIIPGQKKHWTMWWDKFIKWCIFAPVYLFFLMLGLQIGNITAVTGGFGTLSAAMIINTAVVGFIMIAGVFIADKIGVGGSNFVVNYAKNAQQSASKKFKDMRGKSAWSAENIGKKFGAAGARMTAPFGVTERGKRIREGYRAEKLGEQQKKENVYNARQELKDYRDGKSTEHANLKNAKQAAEETRRQLIELKEKEMLGTLTAAESSAIAFLEESAKQHQENISNLTSKLRNKELEILKKIRAGTAPGGPKFSTEDIEKFLKSQAAGPSSGTAKP